MTQKTTSLFAIGILALAISTSSVSAKNVANVHSTSQVEGEVQRAKKVIISGNVEVTIVQDSETKKLYKKEGTAKVKVRETDDAIYVSTKKNGEKAKITLYVKNINRIDASDNAIVNTKNTINVQFLQIILKDNAKADIDAKTEGIYTKLMNESSLMLSGTTEKHSISTNELATLNTDNLNAASTNLERRNISYSQLK